MSTANIPTDAVQEKDGEAAELVAKVKAFVTNIDAKDLKAAALRLLTHDVNRLAEITEARESRERRIENLRLRLQDWRGDNAEVLTTAPERLKEALEKLEERVDADAINQGRVKSSLDALDKALADHKQISVLQKSLERASREENFAQATSLLNELSSLKSKRDSVCKQVKVDLSGSSEGSTYPATPQAEKSSTITELNVKGHEQQTNDSIETSQPEPHQATTTSLEPEAKNAPESILNEKQFAHSLPDASKNDPSDEEPVDAPSKAGSSRNELPVSPSMGTMQPKRTSVELATSSDRDDEALRRIEKGIAEALQHDRFGVAYHLARVNPDALPDPHTVKLIAANYVTDETAPVSAELHNIAEDLRNKAETILHDKQHLFRRDYPSLVVSAALWPALVAPGGPVAQLLSFMESHLSDMQALRALVQATADVSRTGVALSVELLQGGISQKDWNTRVSALQREGENWIGDEHQTKIRFAPATAVWRRIVEEWKEERGASIGYMFKLLTQPPDEINIEEVSKTAEHWRRNPESEIDRIDRSRRESSKRKIEGPSRSSLLDKIRKAISFADRLDELLKARPDKRPTFHTEQAEKLRTAVREHGQAALEEVTSSHSPIALKSEELVSRFIHKFSDSQIEPPASRLRLEDLLNGDLLVDPTISLDNKERETVEVDSLLRLAEQDKFDFHSSIIVRAEQGDFRGAEATFDFADRCGSLDEASADRIGTQIEKERSRVVERLTTEIYNANNQLDAAYAQGILTADEVEQGRLSISQTDLAEDDDFKPYYVELKKINETVKNIEQKRREEMEKRFARLKNASTEELERIQNAIKNNRFQVAEDYIERVEKRKELPPIEVKTNHAFDDFFPEFVEEYTALRDQKEDLLSLVRGALENGEVVGPVDAKRLPKGTSPDGIRLLRAWSELCAARKSTSEKLKEFISALGFTNVKLSAYKDQTVVEETPRLLEVEPIADRRIAQLPDFGSRVDGRYQLIVIRDCETEEAIIQEIGKRKLDGQPPNIVVFLNTLDVEARRELARSLGSGDYHPTLVLDEALIVFLATQHNRRLSSFFDCASAFTFAQPFDPDATEVPPEMFFGRKKEREKILNMSGDMTHLVYGGRRLGKTAVLMDIAREYRSQNENKLVLFLTLKGSGIGENRRTDELWQMFAKQLVGHGIVPPNTIRYESIKKKIQDWLNKDKERRILFLVDEADAFLDAERKPGQGYRVLEQIKHFMEGTQRHFKVVFAGLHNVQRAARDPNTPLAHLGEPVRIGPMLPDSDGDEIENLIRAPLETLGYRFDSSDSVVRIAAETNYYPALVQQFCKELLTDLRENDSQSGPPYTIRTEAVARVFDSKETRDRIRNLFAWTIQLDPRYEFLTYLIAQKSFDNDAPWPRPVPIEEVRTAALHEWRQGFDSDPSFFTFEVLLEEMVSLGILREIQGEGFAIRTRNLRMLLGNDDEIKRRFSDAKGKTIFRPDPSQFRHTLDDGNISSLSAGLEESLLSNKQGVGLVFGTRLAGLDRIHDSLKQAAKKKELPVHVSDQPLTPRRNILRSATKSRKPGIHIVLVDVRTRSDWRPNQIKEILEELVKIDARQRTIRPVFICGPIQAWQWMDGSYPGLKGNVDIREIWLGPCAKGFAHAWLNEREAPASADLENQDCPVDAPWPAVVETAAGDRQPQSMQEAADYTLEDEKLVADIFEAPETKAALRGLSEFGPITADELSDVSSDLEGNLSLSVEQSEHILAWASRLGIAQRDDRGYRLDTAYAIGVKQFFKE